MTQLPPNLLSPEDIFRKELSELRQKTTILERNKDNIDKSIESLNMQNQKLLEWGNNLQTEIYTIVGKIMDIITMHTQDGHLSQESQNPDEKNSSQEIVLESFPEFDYNEY